MKKTLIKETTFDNLCKQFSHNVRTFYFKKPKTSTVKAA